MVPLNGTTQNIDWDKCKYFYKGTEKQAIGLVKNYVGDFSLVKN